MPNFKHKILTRLMGPAHSLEETPRTSSDAKPQSNIKEPKEAAQRTTPIKLAVVVFSSKKKLPRSKLSP